MRILFTPEPEMGGYGAGAGMGSLGGAAQPPVSNQPSQIPDGQTNVKNIIPPQGVNIDNANKPDMTVKNMGDIGGGNNGNGANSNQPSIHNNAGLQVGTSPNTLPPNKPDFGHQMLSSMGSSIGSGLGKMLGSAIIKKPQLHSHSTGVGAIDLSPKY